MAYGTSSGKIKSLNYSLLAIGHALFNGRHLSTRFFGLSTAGVHDRRMAQSVLRPTPIIRRTSFHAAQKRTCFPAAQPTHSAILSRVARPARRRCHGRKPVHPSHLYSGSHQRPWTVSLQQLLGLETGGPSAATPTSDATVSAWSPRAGSATAQESLREKIEFS